MSGEEELGFTININGNNNDSNLVLASNSALINDTPSGGSSSTEVDLTPLTNELNNVNKKIETILGANNVLFDKGVSDIQAPEIINDIPTGAKPGRKTIHLGILNDYSGPYKPAAPSLEVGVRLFWYNVNKQSLLGDQFNVIIDEGVDTGYNPDKHKQGYLSIKDDILALGITLGTPQTLGIYESMVSDNILGVPISWWSGWDKTEYKNVLSLGSSYFIDGINILDYVKNNDSRKDSLKKVFVAGFEGDYGGDFALGVKYSCDNISDLELVGEFLKPPFTFNAENCVEQILQLKPDIICLAVNPSNTTGIVGGLVSALGEEYLQKVLCLASPAFNDAFIKPDFELVSSFLAGNVYTCSFASDIAFNTPGNQKLISILNETKITNINNFLTASYIGQYRIFNVLKKSINKGDIRRASLIANVDETEVDYDGMLTQKLHSGLKLDSFISKPAQNKIGLRGIGYHMSELLITRGTTPP